MQLKREKRLGQRRSEDSTAPPAERAAIHGRLINPAWVVEEMDGWTAETRGRSCSIGSSTGGEGGDTRQQRLPRNGGGGNVWSRSNRGETGSILSSTGGQRGDDLQQMYPRSVCWGNGWALGTRSGSMGSGDGAETVDFGQKRFPRSGGGRHLLGTGTRGLRGSNGSSTGRKSRYPRQHHKSGMGAGWNGWDLMVRGGNGRNSSSNDGEGGDLRR